MYHRVEVHRRMRIQPSWDYVWTGSPAVVVDIRRWYSWLWYSAIVRSICLWLLSSRLIASNNALYFWLKFSSTNYSLLNGFVSCAFFLTKYLEYRCLLSVLKTKQTRAIHNRIELLGLQSWAVLCISKLQSSGTGCKHCWSGSSGASGLDLDL